MDFDGIGDDIAVFFAHGPPGLACGCHLRTPHAVWPRSNTRLGDRLIVVGCIVAGFFVVGIGAAIAIPVFLNQRLKATAAATTVTMPDQIGVLTRATGPAAESLLKGFAATEDPTLSDQQSGVFVDSTGQVAAIVIVARFRNVATTSERAQASADFWGGVQRSAQGTLEPRVNVAPGPLGGEVSCARVSPPAGAQVACIALDPGALVVTFQPASTSAKPDHSFVGQARSAVVHRT